MEKEVFERLLKEFTEVNERATKLKDFILDEEKIKTVDNLNKLHCRNRIEEVHSDNLVRSAGSNCNFCD